MTNNLEQKIAYLLEKTGNSANLRIDWVRTEEQLDEARANGIIPLYQEAFAGPPYEEKFEEDEVMEALVGLICTGGFLLVAQRADVLGQILAFVGSAPLRDVPKIANAMSGFVNPETSSYFAEDAVDKSMRRQGISKIMKSALIEANNIAGYDTMVLRTSSLNIKQIAAVTKSGGRAVSGVFEDVTQTRQDGSEKTDKRGYYVFDKNLPEWDGKQLDRVLIARPGGNETAFVFDQVPREKQGEISKLIQAQSAIIEQVMFVEEKEDGTLRGQMAGGEFCGNATRSFGYLLLEGKDGTIDVEVSGTDEKMRVEVGDGKALTQIPVKPDLDSVQRLNDYDDYTVNLGGISFLVTSPESPYGQSVMDVMNNKEARDKRVMSILAEVNIISEPASGIMVTYEKDGKKCCEPFVFVRDINTLYYESGCGSGSTAVGMVEAIKSGSSIKEFSISQPSGLPLIVTVNRNENGFIDAYVNGPIEILFDGPMPLPNSAYTPRIAKNDI